MEVALHWARLELGWVTIYRNVNHLSIVQDCCSQSHDQR